MNIVIDYGKMKLRDVRGIINAELNMTDASAATSNATQQETADKTAEVPSSIAALEARLTELEQIVHTLGTNVSFSSKAHGVLLPWLERIGERIKAAL